MTAASPRAPQGRAPRPRPSRAPTPTASAADTAAGAGLSSGPTDGPPRRLTRSRENRVIAGVCGGLAAYAGSDATWVRIAWVVVTLITSVVPMLVVYVLLAALLPEAPDQAPPSRAGSELGGAPLPPTQGSSRTADWPAGTARPPATSWGVPHDPRRAGYGGRAGDPPAGPSYGWPMVLGILLVGVGVLALMAQFVPLRWDLIWPISLIVAGAVVVLAALRPGSTRG